MKKSTYNFYLDYPHKCRRFDTNTVELPYFPKAELDCDHPYSLRYKEWREIVDTYFEYVIDYMLNGQKYRMPARLGYLELQKFKGGGIDYQRLKKEGKVYRHTNRHSKGYRVILKWLRGYSHGAVIKHQYLWRINFSKLVWRKIHSKMKTDLQFINLLKLPK